VQDWVPQDLKNKVLKQLVNRQMIGLASKPQNVYGSKKKTCKQLKDKPKYHSL
jgi:hypothetical protein